MDSGQDAATKLGGEGGKKPNEEASLDIEMEVSTPEPGFHRHLLQFHDLNCPSEERQLAVEAMVDRGVIVFDLPHEPLGLPLCDFGTLHAALARDLGTLEDRAKLAMATSHDALSSSISSLNNEDVPSLESPQRSIPVKQGGLTEDLLKRNKTFLQEELNLKLVATPQRRPRA